MDEIRPRKRSFKVDLIGMIANFRSRISDLESLNEQKDALIERLNGECEIHATNIVEMRNTIQIQDKRIRIIKRFSNYRYEKMRSLEKEAEYYSTQNARLRATGLMDANEIAQLKIDLRETGRFTDRIVQHSEIRYRIIGLLKSKISRMEKTISTWKSVAEMWRECSHFHSNEATRMGDIVKSHEATIEKQAAEIADLKSHISALAEISEPEIEDIENEEICRTVIIDFANFPDIVGIAPCGNGCPVKLDSSGRAYDAHEIMCEESDEYSGIDL